MAKSTYTKKRKTEVLEEGKVIVKSHIKVNKITGEETPVVKKYNINADFVPKKVDEICQEFIMAYCVENNELDWLHDTVNKTSFLSIEKDEEGNEIEVVKTCKDYPFVNLRADFVKKFFPGIIVGEKAKPLSLKEQLNALYAKKK